MKHTASFSAERYKISGWASIFLTVRSPLRDAEAVNPSEGRADRLGSCVRGEVMSVMATN